MKDCNLKKHISSDLLSGCESGFNVESIRKIIIGTYKIGTPIKHYKKKSRVILKSIYDTYSEKQKNFINYWLGDDRYGNK